MKLAITMLLLTVVFLALRLGGQLHHMHAGVWYGGAMFLLCAANMWEEWRHAKDA